MSTFRDETGDLGGSQADPSTLGEIPPWRGVAVSPTTVGSYWNERDSAKAFDALINRTGLFTSYSEVCGELLQPRMSAEDKGVRIDRILSPKRSLIDAGWNHGPIGVEIKKSSTKIGPPLSQVLDYSRVWHIPETGTVASIMSQNRIGTCWPMSKWTPLAFYVGEERALTFDKDWRPNVGKLTGGRRTGTR